MAATSIYGKLPLRSQITDEIGSWCMFVAFGVYVLPNLFKQPWRTLIGPCLVKSAKKVYITLRIIIAMIPLINEINWYVLMSSCRH